MLDVVLSLVPVFSLIALGAVLRRYSLLSAAGWAARDSIGITFALARWDGLRYPESLPV